MNIPHIEIQWVLGRCSLFVCFWEQHRDAQGKSVIFWGALLIGRQECWKDRGSRRRIYKTFGFHWPPKKPCCCILMGCTSRALDQVSVWIQPSLVCVLYMFLTGYVTLLVFLFQIFLWKKITQFHHVSMNISLCCFRHWFYLTPPPPRKLTWKLKIHPKWKGATSRNQPIFSGSHVNPYHPLDNIKTINIHHSCRQIYQFVPWMGSRLIFEGVNYIENPGSG